MSLLRPDSTLRANLFPERGWIAGSAASCGVQENPIGQLSALLAENERNHARKRLTVCLSDTYVDALPLQWIDGLHTREERLAYARTVFERAGIYIDGRTVLHALFRSFGALGFAYAVANDLLDELRSVATQYDTELVNVMPVSALAYWHCRRKHSHQLLVEEGGATLLTQQDGAMRTLDVEPAVGGLPSTLARLFARARISDEAILYTWSSHQEAAQVMDAAQSILGAGRISAMSADVWSICQ